MSESSPDLADQRASIAGHIDEISRDAGIKGWALDLNHPDTPVHVELVAGDIIISTFQPQRDRDDINQMVGRSAPSQFHFTPEEFDLLLPFVETHGDVPLSLRVRETGFLLPYYTTLPTLRQLAQEPHKVRNLLAPLRDQAVHLLEQPIEPGAGTLWGHIEIFTIDAGGLVWVSGWMRKGPPVEFGALIVDPDRDRTTAALALATFEREDLPSDAYGVIGIMSTDWQPRQQSADIFFYFGRRAEFYLRLANNVTIMPEADFLRHFEHVRDRLSGRHITTLQQVFTSPHVWALSTERSVGFSLHTAVDRLLLVPGYGCLMEGWVMSPVKPVSRIALRFGDTVMACDPLSLHWKPRHDLVAPFPAFPALAGRAGFVASFFGNIPEAYPSDPILKVIFEDGTSANYVVPRNVISRLGHSATLGDAQALFPAIEYEPFFPDFAAALRKTAKTMAGEVVSLLPGKTDRAAIFAISPETCDAFYLFDMLRRHLQQDNLPPGLVFVAQRSTARSHAIYLFREFVRTTSIKASLILIDSIEYAFYALPQILRVAGARRFVFVGPGVILNDDGWQAMIDGLRPEASGLRFLEVDQDGPEPPANEAASAACFAWDLGPFLGWAARSPGYVGGFWQDNGLLAAVPPGQDPDLVRHAAVYGAAPVHPRLVVAINSVRTGNA